MAMEKQLCLPPAQGTLVSNYQGNRREQKWGAGFKGLVCGYYKNSFLGDCFSVTAQFYSRMMGNI